jgi:hypothetical protein
LQPSLNWGLPLQTYTIFLYALVAIPIAATCAMPLLFYYGAKEKIIAEKPGAMLVRERTGGNQNFKLPSFILLTTGTAALLTSIFYAGSATGGWLISTLSALAFIGLGLIFWGVLFIYIRTDQYTKKTLLSAVAYPEVATLNRIISDLGFKGNPIYLPPKYFTNPEIQKAYIPKQNTTIIPKPEQIQSQESQTFTNTPSGMLVTPPGSELIKLFEKTIGTDLAKTNLRRLQQTLPRTIVEDLEIAQSFEMEIKADKILVQIANSAYSESNPKKEQQSSAFGSTLSSAIACALAKTTGNPIIIEKQETRQGGRNLNIEYRIMDEEARGEP